MAFGSYRLATAPEAAPMVRQDRLGGRAAGRHRPAVREPPAQRRIRRSHLAQPAACRSRPAQPGGLQEPPGASTGVREPPGRTAASGTSRCEAAPAAEREPFARRRRPAIGLDWPWRLAALAAFYALLSFQRLEIFKMLLTSFFPLVVLILAVLGSIVMGLATPTEAAAVGAFGGFLLAAAYRQLTIGVIKESVFLTAKTSAMVCWLFVGSAIFSAAFALLGGQELVEQLGAVDEPEPRRSSCCSRQFIIFILGWPLEWTEIIVIFMPIFIPLLDKFGVDPLFFGLLVALNLQTAFLSPPVAMAAFYLKGVTPAARDAEPDLRAA